MLVFLHYRAKIRSILDLKLLRRRGWFDRSTLSMIDGLGKYKIWAVKVKLWRYCLRIFDRSNYSRFCGYRGWKLFSLQHLRFQIQIPYVTLWPISWSHAFCFSGLSSAFLSRNLSYFQSHWRSQQKSWTRPAYNYQPPCPSLLNTSDSFRYMDFLRLFGK